MNCSLEWDHYNNSDDVLLLYCALTELLTFTEGQEFRDKKISKPRALRPTSTGQVVHSAQEINF